MKRYSFISLFILAVLITIGSMSAPQNARALVFQSHRVGIQVGDGIKTATLPGDNLIYGVLGASLTGSLMLLQNGAANTKFQVDRDGLVVAQGSVDANRICIQGDCKSSWPSIVETDTLQTVTNRDSTTTKGITVDSIDTGLGYGPIEVYLMDQNLRTTDNVTFNVITASGSTSANWNTAYSQRLQWNGGSSGWSDGGAAGRSSLGLGSLAQLSSLGTANISTNIVSSVNGVSNDGGDIDLIQGANVIITPSDPSNRITISATADGGGWTDSGSKVYLLTLTDNVGIGNTAPESSLHVGPAAANPTWAGVKMTAADNANLTSADSNVAYVESAGTLSGSQTSTLNVTATGALTGADASVVTVQAQSTDSTQGSVIRLESEDSSVNFLQGQNAAETEVLTLMYTGGAYFSGNVGINTTGPNYDLEVNGTLQTDNLILGNYYYTKPTCNAATLGNLVFDYYYSYNKPYVCTSTGWKGLDTDYDRDGIRDTKDTDDTNPADADATAADVKTGKTVYANGAFITGTGGNVARPGCAAGGSPGLSGDKEYDWCNNDHDSLVDEMDAMYTQYHNAGYGQPLWLDVAGQTCYWDLAKTQVWGADGQFYMYNSGGTADRYCKLKHGSTWGQIYYYSSYSWYGCWNGGDGTSWYLTRDANDIPQQYPTITSVSCNDPVDDYRD